MDEESIQKVKAKASISFHGRGANNGIAKIHGKKKVSNSFHSTQDVGRYCSRHPEVAIQGDEKCPECTIRLMKIAAKTLEKRAAELALERKEKELDELAKRQTREDKKLVSSDDKQESSSRSSNDIRGGGEGRKKEINALLRWSTGFEYGSAQRRTNTKISPAHTESCNSPRNKSDSIRPRLRRQYSLGQVAKPSEMEEDFSRSESLVKIARLKEGDPVWVKRSDNVWTYATLKSKESGHDASLEFIVNDRGATKKCPVTHWNKFVRIVADNPEGEANLEEEEDEIDAILSDQEEERFATNNTREDAYYILEKSDPHVLQSSGTRALQVDTPSIKSSSSKESMHGQDLPEHHQVSMYTFTFSGAANDPGSHNETAQDFGLSMYTFADEDDAVSVSCPSILGYKSTCEVDKPRQKVSFSIPDPNRSSISSEVDYDADVEVSNSRCKSKAITGNVEGILHRSSSAGSSSTRKHHNRASKMRPFEPQCRHKDLPAAQAKEEVTAAKKKPQQSKRLARSKKKKLGEMGKTIPRFHGQVKQQSFYSALKSIQEFI